MWFKPPVSGYWFRPIQTPAKTGFVLSHPNSGKPPIVVASIFRRNTQFQFQSRTSRFPCSNQSTTRISNAKTMPHCSRETHVDLGCYALGEEISLHSIPEPPQEYGATVSRHFIESALRGNDFQLHTTLWYYLVEVVSKQRMGGLEPAHDEEFIKEVWRRLLNVEVNVKMTRRCIFRYMLAQYPCRSIGKTLVLLSWTSNHLKLPGERCFIMALPVPIGSDYLGLVYSGYSGRDSGAASILSATTAQNLVFLLAIWVPT